MWAPNLLVGGSSDLLDYSISSWTVAGIRHKNPVWMATVEGWHFVISKSTTGMEEAMNNGSLFIYN